MRYNLRISIDNRINANRDQHGARKSTVLASVATPNIARELRVARPTDLRSCGWEKARKFQFTRWIFPTERSWIKFPNRNEPDSFGATSNSWPIDFQMSDFLWLETSYLERSLLNYNDSCKIYNKFHSLRTTPSSPSNRSFPRACWKNLQ